MEYGAERLWIANSHAYLAGVANDAGLIVLDISSPDSPRWLGRYHSPTCSESVSIAGSYAYLAHGDRGLEVIDISQPTDPPVRRGPRGHKVGRVHKVRPVRRGRRVRSGPRALQRPASSM